MPDATRQRVLTFATPDIRDLFFWEEDTLSRASYTALNADPKRAYNTPHPNTAKFPDHKLCYWEHDPDFQTGADGQDSLRVRKYYVADRDSQDAYNFEYTNADIGGQKFNAVRRTYVEARDSWDPASPAMGATMSRDPDDKFASGYVLAQREQKRIGVKQLDTLYVAETRVYVAKVSLVAQKLDPVTGVALATTTTLYHRGEDYSGTPIETAALDSTKWGLSAAGTSSEVSQLSNDWWAVTSQEVIPASLSLSALDSTLPSTTGYLLREYDTFRNFSWPAVIGPGSFSFNAVARKDGATNSSVTVVPDRQHYSGETLHRVSEFWRKDPLTNASSFPVVEFELKSGSYAGAQYRASFSSALVKSGVKLIDIVGTQDPVLALGAYGADPWVSASSITDWPDTTSAPALISLTQQPFRGGFLVTLVRVFRPSFA